MPSGHAVYCLLGQLVGLFGTNVSKLEPRPRPTSSSALLSCSPWVPRANLLDTQDLLGTCGGCEEWLIVVFLRAEGPCAI